MFKRNVTLLLEKNVFSLHNLCFMSCQTYGTSGSELYKHEHK